MPPGKGKRKFLLVAVDYFTKWAEAEAFATITTDSVIKFFGPRSYADSASRMHSLLTTESSLIADRFVNGAPNFEFTIIIPL
jgi:hypothetical protein